MTDPKRQDMPDESGIRSYLKPYRGATAFEVPTTDSRGRILGNNGDELMHRVYRSIAADSDISFTPQIEQAEILVVPPNGALLENYAFPTLLRDRLREYPDLPLVIFPSSALFEKQDPADIFEGRSAPTLLMLREAYSYEQLRRKWERSLASRNVAIKLDHDVVASGHRRVKPILENAANISTTHKEGTLVVARLDIEARPFPAQPRKPTAAKKVLVTLYQSLPARGRSLIRSRVVSKRQAEENALLLRRLESSGTIDARPPLQAKRDSRDISDPNLVSFAGYALAILGAKQVVTNRLHVALPAAAIGTETYLMDSGYHKLRGVYERSLQLRQNVLLISSND